MLLRALRELRGSKRIAAPDCHILVSPTQNIGHQDTEAPSYSLNFSREATKSRSFFVTPLDGRVTPEQIAAVIGVLPEIVTRQADDGTPRVSGSLAAHYAPATPLRFVTQADLVDVVDELRQTGRRCALLHYSQLAGASTAYAGLHLPADPQGYARALYAALRELDQMAADIILVEEIPGAPAWAAIADRLHRAACGAGLATSAQASTAQVPP